jgi:hypothetical protein
MEVSGQLHAPAASPLGKSTVSIGEEGAWGPDPVRTEWQQNVFMRLMNIPLTNIR